MDISQLTYFVVVAKAGSFSQAAKTLAISQPSLSRHVQQLESELGVELLDRYHRPMTLTTAGHFFLAQIEPILLQLEQARELTQRFAQPHRNNHLTIGFVASVLYGLLPEIISTVKQRHPNLDIKLVEINSEQQMSALKSGDIDVGFGRFRHNDNFVQQIFLRHERFVVALPMAHPLASRPDDIGIAFKELLEDTLILYHRTPLPILQNPLFNGETDQLMYLFARHQLSPHLTTKVRDIQIALGLVAAGEGITLVPDSLKTVRTEQIHYHRLRHEDATTPIFMNVLAHQSNPYIDDLLQATYQVYEAKGITYSNQSLN